MNEVIDFGTHYFGFAMAKVISTNFQNYNAGRNEQTLSKSNMINLSTVLPPIPCNFTDALCILKLRPAQTLKLEYKSQWRRLTNECAKTRAFGRGNSIIPKLKISKYKNNNN